MGYQWDNRVISWVYLGDTLVIYLGYIEDILGISGRYRSNVLGIFLDVFGMSLGRIGYIRGILHIISDTSCVCTA